MPNSTQAKFDKDREYVTKGYMFYSAALICVLAVLFIGAFLFWLYLVFCIDIFDNTYIDIFSTIIIGLLLFGVYANNIMCDVTRKINIHGMEIVTSHQMVYSVKWEDVKDFKPERNCSKGRVWWNIRFVKADDTIFDPKCDFEEDEAEAIDFYYRWYYIENEGRIPKSFIDAWEEGSTKGMLKVGLQFAVWFAIWMGFLIYGAYHSGKEIASTKTAPAKTAYVEKEPEFEGGKEALTTWLQENIKYPEIARKNWVQGWIYVRFIVERDGSISAKHTKVVDTCLSISGEYVNGENSTDVAIDTEKSKKYREAKTALEAEVLRVVSSMPKWHPGLKGGDSVRVRYTLPVAFTLE